MISDLRLHPVQTMVDRLANGDYEMAASVTRSARLSTSDLKRAVTSYPEQLIEPPSFAFDALELEPVPDTGEKATFRVFMNLWTVEAAGPSDLTLELLLRDTGDGGFHVESVSLKAVVPDEARRMKMDGLRLEYERWQSEQAKVVPPEATVYVYGDDETFGTLTDPRLLALLVVVERLIDHDFDGAARFLFYDEMGSVDLEREVDLYPGRLGPIPDSAYLALEFEPQMEVKALFVHLDLWTIEEGPSDLALQALLFETDEGKWEARILNVFVP